MKTLTVGEFKAKFSEVIDNLLAGQETTVTYGKKKKIIGIFVPYNKQKIKLGLLERKASVKFAPDFKMTDEELLVS
ncbi:MAG: prevent-host-death protein [Candidatus Pacebacteria bacterium CG10_big_fil_rev_8_21_14_0_10_56_10]|nr:MAG: prevent-host-death protein [Candidatus Pacebacteria bacterium CG10_big_fil_rev_8_21_14_0_10_56_10]